ncbi:MAG: ATP-binding protein, partial [Promethearchaeota archaeon]
NAKRPKINIEEPFETPAGTQWALANKIPDINKMGNVQGIIGFVIDITHQKNLESKLKESEAMYRKAYIKEEFYKDLLAHDMKNILQGILMGLELNKFLLEKYQDDELINNIRLMKEQIFKGTHLISNIMKFSNINGAGFVLKNINLNTILEKSIDSIKNQTFYHPRDLNIKIHSFSKNIIVQASDFLSAVFDNLLLNAIIHNKNPVIEIQIHISRQLKNATDYIRIEFIDNGVGIEDERKEIIFMRGYSEERTIHGSGLGLSLVRGIIKNYKGEIWVEDRIKGEPSKGSKFILLIPEVRK